MSKGVCDIDSKGIEEKCLECKDMYELKKNSSETQLYKLEAKIDK